MIILDQKQRHDTGRARHGDMAALSKLAKPIIDNASDFLQSLSDKFFYHATGSDIVKFSDSPPRGATYFTTDPDSAMEMVQDPNKRLIPVNIKPTSLFDPYDEVHRDMIMGKVDVDPKSLDDWRSLENQEVQSALKDAGFSGYRVRMGVTPNEIGLFDPEQYIKRLD